MFDPSDIAAISDALAPVAGWREISFALSKLDPAPAVVALTEAFSFQLVETEDNAGGKRRWDFGSLSGGRDLDAVDDERLAEWAALAAAVDAPIVSSHLNHLLWRRKYGTAIVYCRAAIASYRAVAELPLDRGVTRVRALERAFDLSRSIGDDEASALIESQARTRLPIEADLDHLGSALGLLEVLTAVQPADLDELFAATVAAFPDVDAKDRLMDRWADGVPSRRTEVRREQLDLCLQAAADADHVMRRMTWLEKAYDLAGRFVPDRQREVLLLIQQVKPDDLQFETFSQEISLPEDLRKTFLADVEAAETLEAALDAIGWLEPLGGSDQDVDAALTQQAEETGLLGLMTMTTIGSLSAAPTARLAPGSKARLAFDRAQYRSLGIGLMSVWTTQALGDIADRFQPTAEQLTAYFTREHIDERRAARIARAFVLFWERHPDDAAHIVLPRIEAALRTWGDQRRLPMITMPKGEEHGGARTLGGVLLELAPVLGDTYGPHLAHVLTDRFGSNIRNNALHGLVAEVGVTDAALLLQIMCFFAQFPTAAQWAEMQAGAAADAEAPEPESTSKTPRPGGQPPAS